MPEQFRIPDEKLFRYSFHKLGSRIFEQGSKGTEIYILKKGAVAVIVDDQIVGLINSPDTIIGEMAFFLSIPRTATLEVLEDAELIVIPGEQVFQHVMKKPELGIKLLKILSRRLANTTKYATRLEREINEYRNRIRGLQGLEEVKKQTLEENLIVYGFITEKQLDECKEEQKRAKESSGDSPSVLKLLVEKGYLTAEQLTQFLETQQMQE
jgi:CRP-like cAMP-binding protein